MSSVIHHVQFTVRCTRNRRNTGVSLPTNLGQYQALIWTLYIWVV